MALSLHRHWKRIAQQVAASPIVRPRTEEERNARLLYINTATVGVINGGILAFLPVFMARLGASSTLIGWLSSAPALLAMLFLVPGAMICERHADQVRVRVVNAQLVRVSYLLCALAPLVVPANYLPLVLVFIWTIKTFPEAIAVPAWTAVMAQAISPAKRAQVNGVRWALLSLVSAISSPIFGWLLDRIAFPLNYQVVFGLSFLFGGLDPLIFARIKVPLIAIQQVAKEGIWWQRIRDYWRPVVAYRPFWVYLGTTMLYRLALNLPAPLFSLYWVKELNAADTLIGLRGTVGYGVLVVGYMFWGRSANRLGHRKVLMLSTVGLALYPLLTGLTHSAVWLFPAAAIWGLTASGVDVGLFDLQLAGMPKDRQPLFAAVWSIAANLAVFVGPLLGAALSNATNLSLALIIAGVAQIAATLPFLVLPKDV
ncbi:MAG: MFS transporter [Anaerolineae bacterium]